MLVRAGGWVFPNRDFVAGEKVLADRCIDIPNDRKYNGERVRSFLTPLQVEAVMKLAPVGTQLEEILEAGEVTDPIVAKIARNSFGALDEEYGSLCIYGSRFNHACMGANNCFYVFDAHGNKGCIFVTAKDIKKGDELTIYYHENTVLINLCFPSKYGFTCACKHCRCPETAALQLRRTEMETTLEHKTGLSTSAKLMCYQALLSVCDALHVPELEREALYRQIIEYIRTTKMTASCADLLYVLYGRYLHTSETIYLRDTEASAFVKSQLQSLDMGWAGAKKYREREWATVNLYLLFPEPVNEQKVNKIVQKFDLENTTSKASKVHFGI